MGFRASRIGPLWFVLLAVGGTVRSADEPAKGPEVPVAKPVVREVTDYEDFAGRAEPSARVDLRFRVTGILAKTSFQAGAQVKEGAVLFEIEPRPYQAQVDQALAEVEVNKATLKLARATLARDQAAAKAVPGSIGQQQLDQDQAAVEVERARLASAEATAALANLKLSYCKVTAPVSGRIGRSQVDPGNLVQEDQTVLATIVVESPMFVYFDVDERTLLRLLRAAQDGKLEADKLPVSVGLIDEEGFSRHGVLNLSSATGVDPTTGTVRVRTSLPNKDGLLLPGMFVRVRLAVGAPHKALLVSDRAIGSDDGLKYVFVIGADNKVQSRRVTVGALQGDGLRVITEGLKADDRVATGRLAVLRPGMTVRPKEADMPTPKPPEKPASPPSVRGPTGPGVLVEATYPGASAAVVSDLVRGPIEEQVNGLEKMQHMRSRCTGDGKYALAVTCAPGTDLGLAERLVQNRVSMALPVIPAEVQKAGVSTRSGTTGVLMIVTAFATDDRFDQRALVAYARLELKGELARLAGVGEVAVFGGSDLGLNIVLDPDRLAVFNLTAGEVVAALGQVKRDGDADPDQLAKLTVKSDGQGRFVLLRDVARVEFGTSGAASEANQDGKPAAALVVYLSGDVAPSKLRAALQKKLADLRALLPKGLDLDATFDFTENHDPAERAAPEYLLLDLDVSPDSAASAAHVLKRSDALLRQIPGVRHVLTLSGNPFDLFGGRPCALVLLSPADARKTGRDEIVRTVGTRLGGIEDVTVRVRDLSAPGCFPRCGYPIDMALHGPDAAEVRVWAEQLAERLTHDKSFTDVWANRDSVPVPGRFVDLDRRAAAARGVAIADIARTLDACSGGLAFGRPWRTEIRTYSQSGDWTAELRRIKVRSANGQMVPLSAVAKVREVDTYRALDFFDMRPMVELTANPAAEVSVEAGQKLCARLADEVRKELGLTAEYRLTWLQAAPKGK